MSRKTLRTRDEFTFSLGGLTTIASFVPAPAVRDNVFRTAPMQSARVQTRRRKPVVDRAADHGDSGV